ncbi:hypothetical protein QWY93_07405 [Echinicola jeungdonensis]|uniref:Uncharacterized protein n=1 Tax=Echinicola jeungdonensis TaxID=709343 RepID=A0ABV5J787_9BACT|nr:hypothetical protein [Echinicola jeungdonensis]MDN3669151.1 hypothetical protein [Echinicola jeungdonensis]
MAEIDTEELLKNMIKGAKGVLKKHWKEAEPFAEQELKVLAENLKLIGKLKLEGKINEAQAKHYFEIQKSSVRIVLLTIEGLGILAVEDAINSALDAVRDTVNRALGWSLL